MRILIALILIFAISFSLTPSIFAQTNFDANQALIDSLSEQNAQIELNAQQAINLIAQANESGTTLLGTGAKLLVNHSFQGTNPQSPTFDSRSWFEYCVNYQDGSECGTTQELRSSFSSFPAFSTLSFTEIDNPLRTLIDASVRTVTDFTGIGNDFCHDAPRWNLQQTLKINGKTIDIPKQLFGKLEFNQSNHVMKNIGMKFTPQLIETLLSNAGVNLRTGDKISWTVDGSYRYTVWDGQIVELNTDEGNVCEVTGELAFDGYGSGLVVNMEFIYIDPVDQIQRPTTTLPDTDGDGIPDQFDQCSFSRETFNGIDDEDGCPDIDPDAPELPFDLQDADGDGIVNGDDDCTFLPENFNGILDGDGCPDGQSIIQVVIPSGEIQEVFLVDPDPIAPLITEEELQEQVDNINETTESTEEEQENIVDLVDEENPETQFVESGGVVVTGNDPSPVQYCNNFVTDCNAEIARVTQFIQMTTGIPLPFEPTVLNLVIVFAIISVIMIVVLKVVLKKK